MSEPLARRQVPRPDGPQLQGLLAVMLDLELSVRHARWNSYGAGFRDLHLHLQVLADLVGSNADEIAEHAVATGVSPDGRATALVNSSPVRPLPAGPILVDVAIALVADAIDGAIDVCQRYSNLFASTQPVTDSIVTSMLKSLLHHRWMLLAEFSAEPPAKPPPSTV